MGNEVQIEKTKEKMNKFDNEQMLLHFADISDEVNKNLAKSINNKKDFNIRYKNQIVKVEQNLLEFAYSYFELESKYRLEAKTLMNEILTRISYKHSRYTEYDIKVFFEEIIKQKKYLDEKEKLKNQVVWVKNKT